MQADLRGFVPTSPPASPIGIRHLIYPDLISVFKFICHQKLKGVYLGFEKGYLKSLHPVKVKTLRA